MMFQPKTSDSPLPSVPACFFMMRDIDRSISGYNICRALESIAGDGNIVGGGVIRGTFRIYPKTTKARNLLMLHGVTIGAVHVNIIDKNPNLVSDTTKPSEKLIIGNIPLSLATEEIHKAINALGVSFRSNWFDERYRNDKNELSLFKTGRRFIYIDQPRNPLPKSLKIGNFEASIYHKSQKPQHVLSPNPPHSENNNTSQSQNMPETGSQSEGNAVHSKYKQSPPVTNLNKSPTRSPTFNTGIPRHTARSPIANSGIPRPLSRSPAINTGKPRPTARSLTRSTGRKPKREGSESRSASAAKKKIIDYFDYNNLVSEQTKQDSTQSTSVSQVNHNE